MSKGLSENAKKSIVIQGSILAFAGIISKIIGFLYRIPMANIMGNTGNGLYSVAFGIYNIALTLSSYSMPLAVSKLMSARLAKKQYKDAVRVFVRALIFAAVTGMIACLVLYFGAESFAGLYHKDGLEYPVRVLAPTTFIVALLGTCRGYYQGHHNMLPTAVSQVIEQLVNAVVSVVAAAAFVRSAGCNKAAMGAMGGTLGTLAGAGAALVIFIGLFIVGRSGIKAQLTESDEITEDNRIIYKAIILTVIPVIISQSIYQLGYTLDDLIFGNIMCIRGYAEIYVTDLQGVFNTQYNQMINLPTAIATSMAAATLPSIVASFTVKDMDSVHKKINIVTKINMLIAIPSFIGLAVLAHPIMSILFPRLCEYHDTAAMLLMTGSAAVVFYALSTMSTSILQGCDRMSLPVIHSAISLAIHVAVVILLTTFTDLGVYGLVIGNVTFPAIVSVLNIRSIKKMLNYRFDWSGTFIKPLIASCVMGVIAGGVYYGMIHFLGDRLVMMILALALSLGIAAIVYAGMLGALHTFTKEEMKAMPIVRRFVK